MNYARVYADIPGPHHLGSVLHLAVTEANSYSPPRATLRIDNSRVISLEPDDMRQLAADLDAAARDIEEMRREVSNGQ